MATIEEQIKEIEDELARTQYNKKTQHHIGKLKAKMARLKDEMEVRRSKGPKAAGYAVKKSGHATVALVGFPSVGKSTLLNKITNAQSEVAAYRFTTLTVIPGLLEHRGAKIQVLDMPGLIKDASKGKGRGKEVLSVVRSADLILLMIDVFETNVQVLVDELRTANLRLNESPPDIVIAKKSRGGITVNFTTKQSTLDEDLVRDMVYEYGHINADVVIRQDVVEDQVIDYVSGNRLYMPAIVVINKTDLVTKDYLKQIEKRIKGWKIVPISAEKGMGIDRLRDEIFDALRFIRIYMKPQGKEADLVEPLVIKDGSDIGMVCDAIHRDFRRNFRYALIWGKSARFPGQVVGLDHRVMDQDIVTIIVRR
ncbi:MAG: GTP-binding protein [Euryarchaeota archaeon RBG_16_62_10]|nr:MAG: GTP-binding protein [Euryarchaeota archaeon RBG_16_62_10]